MDMNGLSVAAFIGLGMPDAHGQAMLVQLCLVQSEGNLLPAGDGQQPEAQSLQTTQAYAGSVMNGDELQSRFKWAELSPSRLSPKVQLGSELLQVQIRERSQSRMKSTPHCSWEPRSIRTCVIELMQSAGVSKAHCWAGRCIPWTADVQCCQSPGCKLQKPGARARTGDGWWSPRDER